MVAVSSTYLDVSSPTLTFFVTCKLVPPQHKPSYTMEKVFRCCFVLLALLLVRVGATEAACSSYGVDYSNGGAYYIDGSSNQYFSFITVFQGRVRASLCQSSRYKVMDC
jgi:hypothetical protein